MKQLLFIAVTLLWSVSGCAMQPQAEDWSDWRAFNEGFIDGQGRVIDWTADARTVSEGQSYALFFALVANDRSRFDQLLHWTERNLAQGDLSQHLPAWLWGQITPDRWGIKDPNSATDADLWIAYSLLEASRLWKEPRYRVLALAILDQVKKLSVKQVENGTLLLLPGRDGFVDGNRVRLNPSYYVPAQLLRFQQEDPQGPWLRLLKDYAVWLRQLAPLGRIPDWAQWQNGAISQDKETAGTGGYDAIRVYLWVGLGPAGSAEMDSLADTVKPFDAFVREIGRVPERWSVGNSGIAGRASPGFHGALLPFFSLLKDGATLSSSQDVLQKVRENGLYGKPARYYDQVLILFGKGQVEGRFRFDQNGRVMLSWER